MGIEWHCDGCGARGVSEGDPAHECPGDGAFLGLMILVALGAWGIKALADWMWGS